MIEDGEVSDFAAVFASILIYVFLTKIWVGIFRTMKHSYDLWIYALMHTILTMRLLLSVLGFSAESKLCTNSVPSSFFCKAVMS